jgi:hypothetical protein
MVSTNTTESSASGKRLSISLVVPCTAEDTVFISRLLRSVNYQTYLPAEVIIPVSGIAPGAARRLEQKWRTELHEKLPLVVLNSAMPAFAGPNRQRGSEFAKGEVISFFDVDDVQAPARLEKIADAFAAEHIKAVFHRFSIQSVIDYPEPDENAWYAGAAKMYHRGWISIRRDVVHKIGWGNEPRAQEFTYLKRFIKVFGQPAIAFLPEFLGHYIFTGFKDQVQYVEFKTRAMDRKLADWIDGESRKSLSTS